MKRLLELLKEELSDDIPVEGFHTDIETETVENENFRKVLFTGSNLQLVLMSLNPNEDIGEEVHSSTDQFIRVDQGSGIALIGGQEYNLKDGSAIIIPAGSKHNITASDDGLKLYTVYAPPEHEDGEVIENKEDEQ